MFEFGFYLVSLLREIIKLLQAYLYEEKYLDLFSICLSLLRDLMKAYQVYLYEEKYLDFGPPYTKKGQKDFISF